MASSRGGDWSQPIIPRIRDRARADHPAHFREKERLGQAPAAASRKASAHCPCSLVFSAMHLSTTLMRLSRSATLLASALIQHFSLIWVAVRRWGLAGCAAGAAATGAADAFGARLVVAESPAQPARR